MKGFVGVPQVFAVDLKLFVKGTTLPSNSNLAAFVFAPTLSFMLILIAWSAIPFPTKQQQEMQTRKF